MKVFSVIQTLFLIWLLSSCSTNIEGQPIKVNNQQPDSTMINKSEEEWKKELSPEQYYVLRQKGTERPFTGQYNMHFEEGVYKCAGCGTELFKSTDKFESHCGWPSFSDEIPGEKIKKIRDTSHGMIRTEIVCGNCGGHLGHVFDDGPGEKGLRYCVNSLSIDFAPTKKEDK